MTKKLKDQIKIIPQKPGAYLFKDTAGRIIYIGKARDLKKRIRSHFSKKSEFLGVSFVDKVADIDWMRTKNEADAMILEDQLIKKYRPRYNIQWKDDKSYFWVAFSCDEWPRVYKAHRSHAENKEFPSVGPFVNGRELKQILRALRKIFHYRTCKNQYDKPCLQWHLGLCPAHKPGKKIGYIKSLNAMTQLLRLYADEKIRIEAYDISNIQGAYATGSMIVFYGNKASKSDYRKFRIRTVRGANDIAMLKEVLSRRIGHPEWPYPDLMLIDGGKAQLNAATEAIAHQMPQKAVVSLAKREEEIYTEYSQKPLPIAALPENLRLTFQHIRDEAHRFAIFYYRYLHGTADYKRPRRATKADRRKISSPPKTQKT